MTTLRASDFGASPEAPNNADQLRRAFAALSSAGDTTLLIEPGVYILRDENAVAFARTIMSGGFGPNPERKMFHPYAPYVEGLRLQGADRVTIDAPGVRILCEGWMEPFSIVDCSNVTVRGLAIDYARKPFSVGPVVSSTRSWFEVEIDAQFPVVRGVPTPRVEFWNATRGELHPHAVYPKRSRLVGPQRLRIHATAPEGPDRYEAMIVHTLHFRPAILLHRSVDVTLSDVSIHSQPGMGIVGHRCHNITLDRTSIVPSAGLHMSTNTDATHFTTCTGQIRFSHCAFEGQGDDSTNIHNYYYTVRSWSPPDRITIGVDAPTGTHAQVLDAPEPGDILEIVDRRSLQAITTCTVRSVENDEKAWQSTLTLSGELPADMRSCLLANVTRLPSVRIDHCSMRSHLARGVLIKTRDVVVESCEFRATTGTAIHVGAESWWHEGVTSADVTIRDNVFRSCGQGNGQIDGASAIAVTVSADDTTAVGLHKRIRIENNTIEETGTAAAILIANAEEVRIAGNTIEQGAIRLRHCRDLDVRDNGDCPIEAGPDVTGLVVEGVPRPGT